MFADHSILDTSGTWGQKTILLQKIDFFHRNHRKKIDNCILKWISSKSIHGKCKIEQFSLPTVTLREDTNNITKYPKVGGEWIFRGSPPFKHIVLCLEKWTTNFCKERLRNNLLHYLNEEQETSKSKAIRNNPILLRVPRTQTKSCDNDILLFFFWQHIWLHI